MSINVIITLFMMIGIVVLIVRNITPPSVAMTLLPILAALLMGFSPAEITSFIGNGFSGISGTLCLMLFAITAFGILHEAGVFTALVNWVLRMLKNSVLGVMFATVAISILTQLDGSGATTALCTIPPLKPVYKKMNIRAQALLLLEGLASGVFTLLPWAPGINEVAAFNGIDVYDCFRWAVPLGIFATVLVFLLCVPLSVIEKRNGAGMSDAEYEELRKEIVKGTEFPLGKGRAIFDGVFILIVMAALLSGMLRPNFAFAIAFPVLLVVNYPTKDAMETYIRKQSGTLAYMALTLFAVGVLVGVNNGTGALAELATFVSNANPAIGAHLPILLLVFSIPLTFLCGNAKNSVIVPACLAICMPYGFTAVSVATAVFLTGSVAAFINPFDGVPFLALGLADVEMKDHLKYSFLPAYGFSLLMVVFLVVSGRIAI